MTKVYQRDDNIHVENINHIISEAIIGRTKDDTSSTIGSFSTKSAKTEELKRKVDEIIKNNIGDMLIETIIPKYVSLNNLYV